MIDSATVAVLMNDIKHIREDAAEIKQQVIKTNGRVTALEKWRFGLTIAFAVILFMKYDQIAQIIGLLK